MINTFLNASISGGIIVLIWYLSYPVSKRIFNASWHYAILKMAMLFMLFPLSLFAAKLSSIFSDLITKTTYGHNIVSDGITNAAETISTHPLDSVHLSLSKANASIMGFVGYLQLAWLLGVVILAAIEIRKFYVFKKQLLRSSNENPDEETNRIFQLCKIQMGLRKKIVLRTSDYIKTPLVVGILKPIIIFPAVGLCVEEKKLAITHELTHVKNGDLWFKFLASAISIIQWFNPLTHLLRKKIFIMSEIYCDECVANTMTKTERKQYGNLILRVVSDISLSQARICSYLSTQNQNIERRLLNMMNFKKSRKGIVALSLAVTLVFAAFGTIYAFAAAPVQNFSADAEETSVIEESGFFFDDGMLKTANDASFVDESNFSAVNIGEIPISPKTTGQLKPGGIYTTTTSYSIAQGQYITYNGSWTPTTQSFDVGIYNTVTGNYTWFNRTGGTITNFKIIINNSSTYKIAFRNPSGNAYDANFNITFVIE